MLLLKRDSRANFAKHTHTHLAAIGGRLLSAHTRMNQIERSSSVHAIQSKSNASHSLCKEAAAASRLVRRRRLVRYAAVLRICCNVSITWRARPPARPHAHCVCAHCAHIIVMIMFACERARAQASLLESCAQQVRN